MMEPIQPLDMQEIMNEAIDAAQKWEGELGPSGKRRKGKAEKAFEALRDGQIKLENPAARLQRLRAKDFDAQKITLAPDIATGMRGKDGYNFYLLPAPLLLYPSRGAQYRLLEAQFSFKVGQAERPLAIQNSFPRPMWKPVLDFGSSLTLALDGNLEWGAEVERVDAKLAKVGGDLAGRIGNQDTLSSFIKVMPFQYTLGRMEIEATYGASTAAWRLDSKRLFHSQDNMEFVILLKVPKEVREIKVEAAAQAEASFNWFIAQVEHVLERLPEAIQRLATGQKAPPLQDFQNWTLTLPS